MTISVIIPCYNVEGWIASCLLSVLDQVRSPAEIICVDDGSTDGTVKQIELIQSRYPGKIELVTQANQGASSARNFGLKIATGEWIQFLDADDQLLPEKLAHQSILLSNEGLNIDLIASAYKRKNQNGKIRIYKPEDGDIWLALAQSKLGITSSNLWRKNTLQETGGWNENLKSSQEADLMFRLLKKGGKVICDPKPLTIVNDREGGSISQSNRAQNWERYLNLRQEMLDWLTEQGALTPARKQVFYTSILGALRGFYAYEPDKAIELASRLLPPEFKPDLGIYGRLYRVFGFPFTEKLYELLGKGAS